jgi:hypothetical protein
MPLFKIHSVSSNRELVVHSHRDEYFHVELKGAEVTASTDVWIPTDRNGLNAFFQELAGYKIPWNGERGWGSLEGEFEISATCTTLGQVIFQVRLAGMVGGSEEWKVQAGLDTELGQLESIAREAGRFFQA